MHLQDYHMLYRGKRCLGIEPLGYERLRNVLFLARTSLQTSRSDGTGELYNEGHGRIDNTIRYF